MILTALLAGCVTKYHPKSGTGGYTDAQLQPDVFTVSFAGNANTSLEIVKSYSLYRCAELTVANGFDYFVIIDQDKTSQWNASAGAGSAVEYNYYTVAHTIKVHKGARPTDDPNAYDAHFLLSSMRVER